MSAREAYLRTVANQIAVSSIREAVQKELSAHMEDQKAFFMEAGMEEAEAEEAAVREMGDPVTVGAALNEVHRPKPVKKHVLMVFAATIFLTAANIISVITAPTHSLSTNKGAAVVLVLMYMFFLFIIFLAIVYGKHTRSLEQRRPLAHMSAFACALCGAATGMWLAGNGSTLGSADTHCVFISFAVALSFIDVLIPYRQQKHGGMACFFYALFCLLLCLIANQNLFFTAEASLVFAVLFTYAGRKKWFPGSGILPYLLWAVPVLCTCSLINQIITGKITPPLLRAPEAGWDFSFLSFLDSEPGIFAAYGLLFLGIVAEIFLISCFRRVTSAYAKLFFLGISMIFGLILGNSVLALYQILPEEYIFSPLLWNLAGPYEKAAVTKDYFRIFFYYGTAGYVIRFLSRDCVLNLELAPLSDKKDGIIMRFLKKSY